MAGIERALRAVLILLTAALVAWTIGTIAWHQGFDKGYAMGSSFSPYLGGSSPIAHITNCNGVPDCVPGYYLRISP